MNFTKQSQTIRNYSKTLDPTSMVISVLCYVFLFTILSIYIVLISWMYIILFKLENPSFEKIYNYLPTKICDFLNKDFFGIDNQYAKIINKSYQHYSKINSKDLYCHIDKLFKQLKLVEFDESLIKLLKEKDDNIIKLVNEDLKINDQDDVLSETCFNMIDEEIGQFVKSCEETKKYLDKEQQNNIIEDLNNNKK